MGNSNKHSIRIQFLIIEQSSTKISANDTSNQVDEGKKNDNYF